MLTSAFLNAVDAGGHTPVCVGCGVQSECCVWIIWMINVYIQDFQIVCCSLTGKNTVVWLVCWFSQFHFPTKQSPPREEAIFLSFFNFFSLSATCVLFYVMLKSSHVLLSK